MAGVPLAMADGERFAAGWCGEWVRRAGIIASRAHCTVVFRHSKEGYCYNETGAGLSIKCVCMSFSSIISAVFTFTRANVSILTFLFVFSFNYCRMGRRLRFS